MFAPKVATTEAKRSQGLTSRLVSKGSELLGPSLDLQLKWAADPGERAAPVPGTASLDPND